MIPKGAGHSNHWTCSFHVCGHEFIGWVRREFYFSSQWRFDYLIQQFHFWEFGRNTLTARVCSGSFQGGTYSKQCGRPPVCSSQARVEWSLHWLLEKAWCTQGPGGKEASCKMFCAVWSHLCEARSHSHKGTRHHRHIQSSSECPHSLHLPHFLTSPVSAPTI